MMLQSRIDSDEGGFRIMVCSASGAHVQQHQQMLNCSFAMKMEGSNIRAHMLTGIWQKEEERKSLTLSFEYECADDCKWLLRKSYK